MAAKFELEIIFSRVDLILRSGIRGLLKFVSPSDEDNYIKLLLEFYIANKDKFKDPLTKNKTLWRMISPKLGLSPEECDKKFRNLKQTYMRLAWKKKHTGKCSRWPYFSYFDQIYEDMEGDFSSGLDGKFGTSGVCDPEPGLGETLRELHERRDSYRRFDLLARLAEESNQIQRERNRILQALLDRR
ncbi:hypothetical protein NE865_08105 [Phthorimaea operculella]|nr:hypothetical protein NE865_08105 [Phthorimaea operculella]